MKWYQFVYSSVAPLYFFVVAIGLYQVFDLDLITLAVVMLLMGPFANWATDQMLYPETRQWFTGDDRYGYGFLIAVSAFAFVVFSVTPILRGGEYDVLRHDIVRYALIWWFSFPVCCAALLVLDRKYNVFAGRPITPPPARERRHSEKPAPKPDNDDVGVIKFDPKRFR